MSYLVANHVDCMAHSDQPKSAFHRRDVVNADVWRVGCHPRRELMLDEQGGLRAILRLLHKQRETDELLQARGFPDDTSVTVWVAFAVTHLVERYLRPKLVRVWSLVPHSASL